eukprot:c20977_g1_i1.p2 GENE.c20977_g1_i1~~c20977_g1_i1.p2  ORF type:complete len:185 (-),score=-121.00 c20977_g1_i1:576-1130(-)
MRAEILALWSLVKMSLSFFCKSAIVTWSAANASLFFSNLDSCSFKVFMAASIEPLLRRISDSWRYFSFKRFRSESVPALVNCLSNSLSFLSSCSCIAIFSTKCCIMRSSLARIAFSVSKSILYLDNTFFMYFNSPASSAIFWRSCCNSAAWIWKREFRVSSVFFQEISRLANWSLLFCNLSNSS